MWSFEKIHRCMAHLFLGQLVSTFDEEFRILFAQSEPLIIEKPFAPMDDFGLTPRRQYQSERPSLYKDPRKFLHPDAAHPEDWGRHPYDDRAEMDWRLMPKRKEIVHGPGDVYSRFPSQQPRMEPPFEHGPSRIPLMESPAFKRHSYAEGAQGRYPFLSQQLLPEPEGRQFHRHPYLGPGKEPEYSGYDKFWNQDYHVADQYPDPTLAQEMEPPENFDAVLNYISSARNVEFDQSSDKMSGAAVDLPFSSPYPKRLYSGQPYACQKSPTPSKSAEQKPFFQEPKPDRKDPSVKRGLRDWRISSYLSTYESKEDEGLPMEPPNAPDPFDDPSTLVPPVVSRIDFSTPKIPNVREFKVPAMPRASQIPGYAKNTVREQTKKLPDEPPPAAAEDTKATPSPSESSSTTEGERAEEAEAKEQPSHLNREDTFRRKYNTAFQRGSRLRSSLIFSSLDQQHAQDGKSTPDPTEEEGDKTEGPPAKQSFISQALGQRKTTAREPFEWSRYINRSATFDNPTTDPPKPEDEKSESEGQATSKDESTKDPSEKNEESGKRPVAVERPEETDSPPVPRSKPAKPETPDQPANPTKPLASSFSSHIDMSDPDARLMFFKELAAKRKAAKAAEAEKRKDTIQVDPKDDASVKKDTSGPEETTEKIRSAKTEEDEKIKEEVLLEQPMGRIDASSGKQDESVPEEIASAEDKNSSGKDTTNQNESAPKETADKMAATATPNNNPKEKESKEKVSFGNLEEKHSVSVKEENLGPNESTEKMREAATPTETTKEETEEKPLKEQPVDLKTTISLRNEPTETMAATGPSTNTNKGEDCREVSGEPLKPEASVLIKKEEEKGNVLRTQPGSVVPTTAAEAEETKEVCTKPLSDLQNLSPVKKEEPDPEVPSTRPVEPEPERCGIKDELSAASLPSEAAEAEKTKEKDQLAQLTNGSSVKTEEQELKTERNGDSENISVTPSSPASQSLEAGDPTNVEDRLIKTDPSSKNVCEEEPDQASAHQGIVTAENNPSASTLPVSAEPAAPPSLPGPGLSSTPSAPKSSPDPADPGSPADLGHSPVSSTPVPENSAINANTPLKAEHGADSSLQAAEENHRSQTEPEPARQDPASQFSTSPSGGDPAHLPSVCLDGFLGDSEPERSSPESCDDDIDKTVPKAENSPGEGSENPGSSVETTPLSLNPSKSDQNEVTVTSPSPNPKSEDVPEEPRSEVVPDPTANAPQPDTTASSPQDTLTPALPSSEANLTGPVSLPPSETESCLSQPESAEPVLSPEAKGLPSHGPSHIPSLPISTDLKKSPAPPSADVCSPAEPTSKVLPGSDLLCKAPEGQSPEPQAPPEKSKEDGEDGENGPGMPEADEGKSETTDAPTNTSITKEPAHSEKTDDQERKNNCIQPPEVAPGDLITPPPQAKLPKGQSRYQSSTANVISSSNLRDDTKLLLEQISANSQSRSEAGKDPPATDDEKEDEADKNAKRKERGFRTRQPKSSQERDKLLEKIQGMRKERKVYSRFEV